MGPWWQHYQPSRESLGAQLTGGVSAPQAQMWLQEALDATLESYLEEETEGELRAAAAYSAALTGEACTFLSALPRQRPRAPGQRARANALWAPLLLSGVLIVYLFLSGVFWPALLTAVCTILWLVLLLRAREGSEQPEAEPTLSAPALLQTLDAMMLETDRWLTQLTQQGQLQAAARLPALDEQVLEAVQMLAEAQGAGDGAYALKALPGLFAALLRKQVVLSDYRPERAEDFDLFPTVAAPRTIRPAVYLGEALVLRGQATQRVPGPEEGV